jgi:4-hydroxy-tetrahydrodipicolinate reductase
MSVKICLAGSTGWVGRALLPAIRDSPDLELVGAVAVHAVGRDAGEAIGRAAAGVIVSDDLERALAVPTDVLIDYTAPEVVKQHVITALERGVNVVVGTSGLTSEDYAGIAALAAERGVGVVAAGNFSLTAALWQHLALIAATRLPHWEIIDYGDAAMPHVPSGTARELAERLATIGRPPEGVALERLHGPKEARGADIQGTRVHSVRSPGFVLSAEVVFGLAGERLTIRHDAYNDAQPYVAGTLLAARRVVGLRGLVRGLDSLLFAREG